MSLTKDVIDSLLSNYKNPVDPIGENGQLKQLTKVVEQRALQAEIADHPRHDKNESVSNDRGNKLNSKSQQTFKGELGELPINIPRDRECCFQPQVALMHQTRCTGFDDKIISLYSRCMTLGRFKLT